MTLIFYEIMREAGLRLPKVVGHAVSIIGAIVIGEATVSAGLIGAPMLVIIAITAIASYVACRCCGSCLSWPGDSPDFTV